MALLAVLESVDGLSEDIKKEYIEKDGKFVLDVTGADGFDLENVAKLRSSLSAARSERDEFKKKLSTFEGLDPDEAHKALETLANLDEVGEGDGAELEKLRERFAAKEQALLEKHRKDRESWDSVETSLNDLLDKQEVKSVVAEAIREHRGESRFLQHEICSKLKVERSEDGERTVRVIDQDGQIKYSDKVGQDGPMSVSELVGKMKEDPVWGVAFEETGATGGGATGSTAGRGGSGRIDQNLAPAERLTLARRGTGS